MKRKQIIAVDLDGTLTDVAHFPNFEDTTPREMRAIFDKVKPNKKMIAKVNRLKEKGYLIYIFTSRNDSHQTQVKKWLERNGVQYDFFIMNKPYYDLLIDDKSVKPEEIL